ncbi:MAG: DJ-1/PfpI family protein [Caulobacter sp.]|nr:DJ-1/PfpI family protein [Caulobacter sp.]
MKRCIALFNHGWADWEAGFVLAVLREYFGFAVRIATPGGVEATSIGGVRAAADLAFDAVDPTDTDLLLVIGSASWIEGEDLVVSDLLRRADAVGLSIGAICAGTLAAARAGLLDDRPHTSNDLAFLRAKSPAYAGAAHYQDAPVAARGGNVVTAPGSAPTSFAVAVLRLVAPEREADIAAYEAMLGAEHAHPKGLGNL